MTSNKVDIDLVTVVMNMLSEDLNNQVREESSWRKSMWSLNVNNDPMKHN